MERTKDKCKTEQWDSITRNHLQRRSSYQRKINKSISSNQLSPLAKQKSEALVTIGIKKVRGADSAW